MGRGQYHCNVFNSPSRVSPAGNLPDKGRLNPQHHPFHFPPLFRPSILHRASTNNHGRQACGLDIRWLRTREFPLWSIYHDLHRCRRHSVGALEIRETADRKYTRCGGFHPSARVHLHGECFLGASEPSTQAGIALDPQLLEML